METDGATQMVLMGCLGASESRRTRVRRFSERIRLARRMVKIIARGIIAVVMTAWVGTAVAEPYVAHTDLELRVGGESLCGTCGQERVRTTVQVMGDRLFPVRRIGDGALEVGPYAKGALLDGGHVPQIAGGALAGYRFGAYEVLANVGLAYATERIGSTASPDSGQTKHSYDLGLTVRYDMNRYFLSTGYMHNSNGHSAGLNFISGKGSNPGIDSLFIGVGVRF